MIENVQKTTDAIYKQRLTENIFLLSLPSSSSFLGLVYIQLFLYLSPLKNYSFLLLRGWKTRGGERSGTRRLPDFFIHFVRNVAAHVLYCSYGLFFYEAEITSGHIGNFGGRNSKCCLVDNELNWKVPVLWIFLSDRLQLGNLKSIIQDFASSLYRCCMIFCPKISFTTSLLFHKETIQRNAKHEHWMTNMH